ncbi:MAG: ATP-binding protein, partial [Acidimicrobiales bacterium]
VQVRALEVVAEAASAAGEHEQALAAAEEAIGLSRLRESAHQRLIAAHARAGNRPAALRAFERCRVLLAEELGATPSAETEAAYRQLLGDAIVVEGSVRTNLPDRTTTFVGREVELDEIRARLGESRLVTLTGPAGVGKSRLAHRIAAGLVPEQPDGVWLVDLAGLRDPALVADRILSTLGLPELPGASSTESLLQALTGRRALLVLDNCEHLVPACTTLVDALLETGLALRLLAASRVPLGSRQEVAWPVPALPAEAAARLFRDRAGGIEFAAGAVAGLCELLMGVPLAIELAAAATRTAPLADVTADLRRRIPTPDEDALAATLASACERLPAELRTFFDGLSVFAGGFTAEAAVAVCGAPPAAQAQAQAEVGVHAALDALDRAALVTADHGRNRIHETVRQHGGERLSASGDEDHIRSRHLRWAVDLAEVAEAGLEGAAQTHWLAVLDTEHDNIRVAHDWAATSGQAELGLRLAAALVRYWEIRGHLREGRARLARWTDVPLGDAALRAKALNAAAVLAQRQHDLDAARASYEESLVIRRTLEDRVGASVALHGLANLAVADDDFATARTLFEENLAIGRELGHRRMVAASLMNLGVLAHYSVIRNREPASRAGTDAKAFYEASLAAYRELGDRYGEALALENLGGLGPFLGDLEGSHARHEESMAIRRELGDKMGIAASARFLATRATWNGEFATARQLHEERLVIERELGNEPNMAEALASLAEIADREGDHAQARRLLNESVELYQEIGDRGAVRTVLALIADVARHQGDWARSRAALDAADRLARELGEVSSLRWHTVPRAKLARREGDLRTALRLSHEAMALAEREDVPGWLEAASLELLAGLSVDQREFPRAARLLGAAAATRPGHAPGFTAPEFTPPRDPDVDRDRNTSRDTLGHPLFEALFGEGQALAPAARRAYARGGVDE